LIKRDPKGLYAKALRGEIQNFSGISDPYEPPLAPEITVHTDSETVDASRDAILRWLEGRRLI
jgi:adenylylsulfate kinase-like enzyme